MSKKIKPIKSSRSRRRANYRAGISPTKKKHPWTKPKKNKR